MTEPDRRRMPCRSHRVLGLVAFILTLGAAPASAQADLSSAVPIAGPVPIPPGERALRTELASDPIAVPDATKDLEGPQFEADGALVFSDTQGRRVLRLERTGRITTVLRFDALQPAGLAVRPDGRIVVAAADTRGGGAIVSIAADGSDLRELVSRSAGFLPNDIAFDGSGGFYFTDGRGAAWDPTGGVYYVAPGGSDPVSIAPHLAVANGIALDETGKHLWIGEFAAGRLHRLRMSDATTHQPFGTSVPYRFTGPAPDSMRTDREGNLYVAIYGGGRVLVFAPSGVPIGQILIPGREAGNWLNVTSLAIRPGTPEMVIVTSGGDTKGARVFRARAYGTGR